MTKKQPNQFERLITLIGEDKLALLLQKKVLVVGLGGVGGYVVEALARSGIGTIVLVDYDTIDITNLNRQIIALHSTIGMKKTNVLKNRILDINPNCNVIVYDMLLNNENYLELFSNQYDFIIDCCDDVKAKKLLLKEAVTRDIEYISSMGTANKLDPTKLKIVNLVETVNDPLAKIMRKYIKNEKISKKIMVLSSTETPMKQGNKLGSISYLPSMAGLLIASYVITKLSND